MNFGSDSESLGSFCRVISVKILLYHLKKEMNEDQVHLFQLFVFVIMIYISYGNFMEMMNQVI